MSQSALIYNEKSGTAGRSVEFKTLLEHHKNSYTLFNLKDKNILNLVEEIGEKGFTTIIAAGGDGTVSAIAHAILTLGLDVKLGVLPLGTFNHFAKDIGMPMELTQAFEVFSKSNTTYIDVGKVNDTFFINNSSLGLYPSLVRERDAVQKRGFQKWLIFLTTLPKITKLFKLITLEFEVDGKKIQKKTPFLFIGNNRYELSGLRIGTRAKLTEGILCICLPTPIDHWRLLRLVLHAFFGTLREQKDFNVIGLQECNISSSRRYIQVSLDGEIKDMKSPLLYKSIPKALKVITK